MKSRRHHRSSRIAVSSITSRLLESLLVLVLLAVGAESEGVRAQAVNEEAELHFGVPDPAEIARMREVLDAAVPTSATYLEQSRIYAAKVDAGRKLGLPPQAYEQLLRKWSAADRDTLPLSILASEMRNQGRFEEAIVYRRQVINQTPHWPLKLFFTAELAHDYFEAGRMDDARKSLDQAMHMMDQAGSTNNYGWVAITKARYEVAVLNARISSRAGRWTEAMAAADQATERAWEHYRVAQALPDDKKGLEERNRATTVLAGGLNLPIRVALDAGRLGMAEVALAEFSRVSGRVNFDRVQRTVMHGAAADLRFLQGEFRASEGFARAVDAELVAIGRPLLHPQRRSNARRIVAALEGQMAWTKAFDALAELDSQFRKEGAAASGLFPFERGLAYLFNGHEAEAIPLFEQLAAAREERFGAQSFFVAEAIGLQGVAIWRSRQREHCGGCRALLQKSVRSYMAAENADYLENIGMRRFVRNLIFSAYIDVMAKSMGGEAIQTLGVADWLRGSAVQDAIVDSAVRSAVREPGLSELVRLDQDARSEMSGIRRYLSLESARSAASVSEARSRMLKLEAVRRELREEIKRRYPEYDRLVSPVVATVSEVARNLTDRQVFVAVLPISDATLVWAVRADGQTAFSRIEVGESTISKLVNDLRRTLDIDLMPDGLIPFNENAARELYRDTLGSVERLFVGADELIVSAGGAMSRIPLGVLLTGASVSRTEEPWLIRRMAVTQVVTASAWLSRRAHGGERPARPRLFGLGDPAFGFAETGGFGRSSERQAASERSADFRHVRGDHVLTSVDYSSLPPLPDTREELLAIAKALGADPDKDLMLGSRATRQALLEMNRQGKLRQREVLVFATHGLMAGDLPSLEQPALALAASSETLEYPLKALLTLDDVLGLRLDADWVVLSACNTAAGDGRLEEALSGLARGFFYAGARSLLVTHWAVETRSAKLLSSRTFEYYAENTGASKTQSLRHAMLSLMRDPRFTHPAFWAPYALIGDGGR